MQMLAGLLSTAPFSLFMGRFGRRSGFIAGAAFAFCGGAACAVALHAGNFFLLCIGHMALGAALACYQYFRFAAAEVVPERWQPVAISLMLGSGLAAAFAGPQIFIWTKDYWISAPLAGAYAAISGLSLIGMIPLLLVRRTEDGAKDRPAGSMSSSLSILRRPNVCLPIFIGAASQGVMVLLMTSTPLAMIECGFSESLSGDVIRWHVVAMFGPSFVTGFIIKRYGVAAVIGCGIGLLILSALVAASGLSRGHFYIALVLLGIGWNFGFIGATSMLASIVDPEDRAIAQGANNTVIALFATICAFVSGAVVTGPGWAVLSLSALPLLGIAAVAMFLPRLRTA
jgi:predicted MFS family arabinose efflux permease